MNLLGEGFPDEIINQIENRQKVYGSGYAKGLSRTPEEILYLNGNTSWVKLISSVNINNQAIIQNESLRNIKDIDGNKLAKKFILFNGVNEAGVTINQRKGIDTNNDLLGGNSAYGIGGNEFGARPMMGIQNAHIKHENRGSLRRATVKIKAFNKVQFDIIDILYLRLGFNVLLEWGHSMYIDEKGILQKNTNNSLANYFLTGQRDPNLKININDNTFNYSTFLKYIDARRKQSSGNYDAMFAKVTNFHWSFLPDGSYDITVDLVSIGDIIESFKINTLASNKIPSSVPAPPTETPSDIFSFLDVNANKSTLHRWLFDTQQTIFTAGDKLVVNGVVEALTERSTKYPSTDGNMCFIRLGYLLNYIQEFILYKVGNNDRLLPLIKIDKDVESNLMYVNGLQVSIDPTVCAVRRKINIGGNSYEFLPNGTEFISSLTPPSKAQYGKIMNIYLNMRFIVLKLDESKDENGNLSLISFFKSILAGINGALGGINSLDAFIDETTNTIQIIDRNPFPDTQFVLEHFKNNTLNNVYTKYAKFELYGYNPSSNSAGFIKDFSFKTELSPAMSTMITVGAVANGNVVGENATALSRLNSGLVDRFKENITDDPENISTTNIIKKYTDVYVAMKKQWGENYAFFTKYLKRLSVWDFTFEEASTYKDSLTNYNNAYSLYNKALLDVILINQNKTSTTKTFQPSTGFIPFNLSLTMDGLSGMKINSKFLIDSSYLPSNYPETVDFLIKNLEHTIENNKWTTTLESYCISKGEFDEVKEKDINPNGQKPVTVTNPRYQSTNGRWANELRNTLASLGYTEKGSEIDNGGDIQENLSKLASNIFTQIKQKYPNLKIRVTGGNDVFHQELGYTSQHKRGTGLDFTIFPSTPKDQENIENILKSYKTNVSGFAYINEYKNLSNAGTAPHFHIQL